MSTFKFTSKLEDTAKFQEMQYDYYVNVLKIAEAAGAPKLSAKEFSADSIASMQDVLPPRGRTLIATGENERYAGCGQLRRVRDNAVEMKRIFVRPEAQGTGLGRRLFEMLLEEAHSMGMAEVFADTVNGNSAMLNMFEKYGFEYIDRYPENANPPEFEPFLVYLRYQF